MLIWLPPVLVGRLGRNWAQCRKPEPWPTTWVRATITSWFCVITAINLFFPRDVTATFFIHQTCPRVIGAVYVYAKYELLRFPHYTHARGVGQAQAELEKRARVNSMSKVIFSMETFGGGGRGVFFVALTRSSWAMSMDRACCKLNHSVSNLEISMLWDHLSSKYQCAIPPSLGTEWHLFE